MNKLICFDYEISIFHYASSVRKIKKLILSSNMGDWRQELGSHIWKLLCQKL